MGAVSSFFITPHATRRFLERFPELSEGATQRHELREIIWPLLNAAEENKRVKNDTGFMAWLHDRHGFDRHFRFFVNGDVLFVCAQSPSYPDKLSVLTVLSVGSGRGVSAKIERHLPAQGKAKRPRPIRGMVYIRGKPAKG